MFQVGLVFKDGKVIAHRSYCKIFLNPLLRRWFGKTIGSVIEDEKFVGYKIIDQCEPISWSFSVNFEHDCIKGKCMAVSLEDVQGWIEEGKEKGATHIISVCDTFDWDDYPVYVYPHDDVDQKVSEYRGKSKQRVNEVIDLSKE